MVIVTVTTALVSFAVMAGLLTIIPGLDTALVLRATLAAGRRYGVATALGVNTGVLAWGVAAAVGVTALLTASAAAFAVLKFAGVAYLLWLGANLLRTSWRRPAAPAPAESPGTSVGTSSEPPGSLWGWWWRGTVTNLLNPKVGVFYAATIPQFLPEGTSHLAMGLLLALVHDLEGLLWFGLIIALAGAAGRRLADDRARRVIDRVTGGALVLFAVRLATEG